MNILVTHPVLLKCKEEIEAHGHPVMWRVNNDLTLEDVKQADIILGQGHLDLLEHAENLKYMHATMAGSDPLAKIPAIQKAILTNSTGVFSLSIAEFLITMVLYFYKNLGKYLIQQKEHNWNRIGEIRAIEGSNVLVIGAGSIGMAFAERIHALGAHVVGIKKTPGVKPEYLDALYQDNMLDECISKADIIALCLPQNDSTKHIMNKERLSKIKENALLLNIGRASAIDTEAMIELLKEHKFNAGLDVFDIEPLPKDSPLWDMDNVVIFPHVTGTLNLEYTNKLCRQLALENLDAFLNGKPLKNVVDFKTGYKISNT